MCSTSRSGRDLGAAVAIDLTPVEAAVRSLDDLARLEPDWDSYDALPPTATAIQAARGFLLLVAERLEASGPECLRPFTVVPVPDGGVQIEWRSAVADLEIEIGPDGTLSSLLIEHAATEPRYEEAHGLSCQDALRLVARVVGARLAR